MDKKQEQQRLYINTDLQKQTGNDTDFTLNVGANFQNVKRMVLNSVEIDNYFLNFNSKYKDFSIEIGAGIIPITLDYYISKDQLVSFLNTYTIPQGLTLTDLSGNLQPWDYRLLISGNVNWRPVGYGFVKCGFPQNQYVLALQQQGQQVYNFAQTGAFLIRFMTLPNSIGNSVVAAFNILNRTTFGTRLVTEYIDPMTYQQVVFQSPQQFSQLEIQILDADGQLLQTVQGNNNEIQVVMDISCYSE